MNKCFCCDSEIVSLSIEDCDEEEGVFCFYICQNCDSEYKVFFPNKNRIEVII